MAILLEDFRSLRSRAEAICFAYLPGLKKNKNSYLNEMKSGTIVELMKVFSHFSPKALNTNEFIVANVDLSDSELLQNWGKDVQGLDHGGIHNC